MKRIALIRPMPGDSSLVAQERREQLVRQAGDDPVDAASVKRVVTRTCCDPSSPVTGFISSTGMTSTSEQQAEVSAFFDTQISPVLTPLGLDAAHPFPYVSNLSTSWAFRLQDPVSAESVLVRVKVPRELQQWVRVRTGVEPPARVFVGLDQVIAANAERLFPGMVIESASLFRVCRDAEVELDDDDVDGERQARAGRARSAATPLRARRPARSAARCRPGDAGRAEGAVRARRRRRLRDDRATRLHDAVRNRRARDRAASRPALDAARARRSRHARRRHLLGDPCR